jgi:peptide/nickel transport system permease protein
VTRDLTRFVARRALSMVLVVIGMVVVTFIVTRLLPSDPARQVAGIGATPDAIQAVRVRLGLDQSVWSQFWQYLKGLAHLDFGTSFVTGRPVRDDIVDKLPATLELAFFAVFLYTVLSLVLGTLAASGRSKVQENAIRVLTLAGSSIPPYWLALVLQVVFYFWLGWFPSGGRLPAGYLPDQKVTGFYLIDSLLAGDLVIFWKTLVCLVLPATSLLLVSLGSLTRLVRAQILDEQRADYVTMSRARGLAPGRILRTHVLPNALNPVITVIGMQVGFLIGGTLFIEKIFQWPGLGSYTWDAVTDMDFPAITGVAVVLSVVFVLVTLIVDIVQFLLDPRVRAGQVEGR